MPSLYPLKFELQFDCRPWGGRRLAGLVSGALPDAVPVGEAWLLSDRDEHASVVAEGPLKGTRLRELMEERPLELLGAGAAHLKRFPLLLKFLDVKGTMSVQLHPAGDQGRTEGWVVLASGSDARIYAGLKPETTVLQLGHAFAHGAVPQTLSSFVPQVGEAILIPAGTMHCLHDVVVFEVQENADVTYRLYDWNRADVRTHAHGPLQLEQALSSVDYSQRALQPAPPSVECAAPVLRERLLDCDLFRLDRIHAQHSFMVGAVGAPRILVCIAGQGAVLCADAAWPLSQGECMLLPAVLGVCDCVPERSVTLLEVALPQAAAA